MTRTLIAWLLAIPVIAAAAWLIQWVVFGGIFG